MQTTNDKAVLNIGKCKRGDTGNYNVILKNPSGVAEHAVKVTVLGKLAYLSPICYIKNKQYIYNILLISYCFMIYKEDLW